VGRTLSMSAFGPPTHCQTGMSSVRIRLCFDAAGQLGVPRVFAPEWKFGAGRSMKEWIKVLKAADAAARWHVHRARAVPDASQETLGPVGRGITERRLAGHHFRD
jgi:hypothetical protein